MKGSRGFSILKGTGEAWQPNAKHDPFQKTTLGKRRKTATEDTSGVRCTTDEPQGHPAKAF